jgi:hypothetical protein
MKTLFAVVSILFMASSVPAHATVPIYDNNGWKVSTGGYIEMDTIHDSTRSFGEVMGSGPVARSRESANGLNGREQFSIRDSRLGFQFEAPEIDGWKSKAYYEFDFLGFDPSPGSASTSANNTEAGFFNSPTLRSRHLYFQTENNGFQVLIGQTWNLFGWQGNYFIPTQQVMGVVGEAYNRTSQIKVQKLMDMGDNSITGAISANRPVQRDGNLPDIEAGVRWVHNTRSSGYNGSQTGVQKAVPMSLAATGTWRQFKVPSTAGAPDGNQTTLGAWAAALDAMLPIIASSDNKDVSNTLSLGGEYTFGKGYGDQFSGFTGGMSSPLTNNANSTAAEKSVNLDAGLGGYDANSNFNLIKLRTWSAWMQYHFAAASRTWMSLGYSNLYSSNISDFTTTANSNKFANGNFAYNKNEMYFGNVGHDITNQIRVAFEYAYTGTTYVDTTKAPNNRYQVNGYFIF